MGRVDNLDDRAIAQIRQLLREGTISDNEARGLMGLPPIPRVTVNIAADTSALTAVVAAIRAEVHRGIRDLQRRNIRAK